jgi:hypothetical protein
MNIPIRFVWLLALLSWTQAAVQADVLVVDASGGSQYLQIQAAVDAAHDGDTLLVKTGTYSSFAIVAKSLSVVGDANATVTVTGGVEVRSLAADRDVVLSNLVIDGQIGATDWHGNGVYLKNDLGSVRVQRCTIVGGSSSVGLTPPCAGVEVDACADVGFVACSIVGGTPLPYFAPPGLHAKGSMIAIYDSSIEGAGGYSNCASGSGMNGGDGGPGASIIDSFLFASGAGFVGGNGGDAPGWPCAAGNGGNGGDGLDVLADTSVSYAELLDTMLVGGQRGVASCSIGCGHDGNGGAPSTVESPCVLDVIPGFKRVLAAPTVVRELAPFTLSYQGQPGDEVGVFFGTETSFDYLPALNGVKMVATDHPPLIAAWLGIADPITGRLSASLAFPDLGAGVQSKVVYLQAIAHTAQGTQLLGTPTALVVLDQSF